MTPRFLLQGKPREPQTDKHNSPDGNIPASMEARQWEGAPSTVVIGE